MTFYLTGTGIARSRWLPKSCRRLACPKPSLNATGNRTQCSDSSPLSRWVEPILSQTITLLIIMHCHIVINLWRASPCLVSLPAYQEVIKVIQPVVLGKMIQYFENYDPDNYKALYETLGYAAGLSLCTIFLALLHHLYFYHVQRAGMKIRVAMCHMIYKKVSTWLKYQGHWKSLLNCCSLHDMLSLLVHWWWFLSLSRLCVSAVQPWEKPPQARLSISFPTTSTSLMMYVRLKALREQEESEGHCQGRTT